MSSISFLRIIKFEIKRFKDKGLHLITAIIISIAFFTFYPMLMVFIYPKLLATFDLDSMLIYGTTMTTAISFFLFNTLLYFCYISDNPRINKYKISKSPWPWKEDKSSWNNLLSESIRYLLLNLLIISPLLAYLVSFLKSPFKIDADYMPSGFEIAFQLLICMLSNDFSFHFFHKFLHSNEFLYKKIHSKHHKYNNPVGISALFAHPLEFILSNVLPAALGPIILGSRMHIVTVWAWSIYGVGETIEQHSGYEFPFSPYGILPFMFNASYHDFHHTRFRHNYSSVFIFLDCIFGDNDEYYNYLDKRKLDPK